MQSVLNAPIIRRLTPLDAEQMAELERICFPLPWSLTSILFELNSPIALYLGAFSEEQLIGYAGMHIILDEGHITNFATKPEFRQTGIADRLMSKLMKISESQGVTCITLEVRESNTAAQNLYGKYGFIEVAIRKNYYDEPKEDAVIMGRFSKT